MRPSLCRPFLGASICEVGAGIGNLTRFFLSANHLTVVEPHPPFATALTHLAKSHLNLSVYPCTLAQYAQSNPTPCECLVCINVLEHIQDDQAALATLAQCVTRGGNIILYVPACPWSFGELDRRLGHFRRYTKRAIRTLAKEGRFHIKALRYVNGIGAFGWWWKSRILRAPTISPRDAQFVDRLVPYISSAECLIPPLIGQSLFAVLSSRA